MESHRGKLFIGGVSTQTNDQILKEYFGKYGEVEQSMVIKDRITNKGRGFGFVTFSDPSVIQKVLNDEHNILGKKVEVKLAEPKVERHQNDEQQQNDWKSKIPQGTNKIFVGGLPSGLTTAEFTNYFESFGWVMEAVIMYDKQNKKPRGFGFITFDSKEAAETALVNQFHELKNKRVEVKRAEPMQQGGRMCGYNCCYYTGLDFGNLSISSTHCQPYHPYPSSTYYNYTITSPTYISHPWFPDVYGNPYGAYLFDNYYWNPCSCLFHQSQTFSSTCYNCGSFTNNGGTSGLVEDHHHNGFYYCGNRDAVPLALGIRETQYTSEKSVSNSNSIDNGNGREVAEAPTQMQMQHMPQVSTQDCKSIEIDCGRDDQSPKLMMCPIDDAFCSQGDPGADCEWTPTCT